MTAAARTPTFSASSFPGRANADCVDQLAARLVSASVIAGCPGRALRQAIKG